MRNDIQYAVQPMSPIVKKLILLNIVLWFFCILILQNYFLSNPIFYNWFGLIPYKVINSFWVWQPFTYQFFHSNNVFHIIFNMLLLWWLGSELERYWGRKYFLFYYLACGIGAAFIYLLATLIYYVVTANPLPLQHPVVGASGCIFGLILAYGLLFGERTILFFMLFPMKAKYFVMILGAIEVLNLIGQGFSSPVANLAHLGGLMTGYILLKVTPRLKDYLVRRQTQTRGRKLKLVVDNDTWH